MIDQKQFDDRVKALWVSQKSMGGVKLWKSGKRAGMVRKQAAVIAFTRDDLHHWLMGRVGLGITLCPYCSVPIDILSLTIDHVVPRSIGGEFSLANMQAICKDCNERKGDMTHEAFKALLRFLLTLSQYDQSKLLSRLKAAHHGSARRFFRVSGTSPQYLPPPSQQDELGAF